jgi:hypothetical protein
MVKFLNVVVIAPAGCCDSGRCPGRLRDQEFSGPTTDHEPVLNSVIVMMVVTSILGPILAEVFGKRLPEAQGLQIAEGEPSAAVATGA